MDGVEDLEDGFEDANNDNSEEVEFTKGDEGEKFAYIIQRLYQCLPTKKNNLICMIYSKQDAPSTRCVTS